VKIENPFCLETQIRPLGFKQAPHEQSGDRQKYETTCDLSHDEEGADPMAGTQ
jgi:hypothetical protein